MVLTWQTYCIILTGVFLMDNFMDMAESCDKDEDCKPHQVCCDDRCKSWPMCFLNSDKECYYDTHCVKGTFCVGNVCKSKKLPPNSCRGDNDCVFQKHSKSYDSLFNNSRCCRGECFKTKSCLELEINTTLTTPKTAKSSQSCWSNSNCLSGFECINARCRPLTNVVDASPNTDQTDNTLSRAGFLSAAILTSAVFLTVMCFCFLKETKYVRRHMERWQARESLTQTSCCSTAQHTTVTTHDTTAVTSPWMLFPRFNQIQRSREHREDCNSTCTGPPSYHSVCFEHELPPSYDEAVNCRCESYESSRTNTALHTNQTCSCYA